MLRNVSSDISETIKPNYTEIWRGNVTSGETSFAFIFVVETVTMATVAKG